VEKTLYRPEIDGLRALAVVAVVLFHVGLGFPGGYVGVDVFFVISGFLIAGIIRRGLERSTFSLAEFWERRVRRIFPALFVMVVGTLGLGYCLLLPQELEELGKSSVAQALLLANVYFWRDTGYFAGPAELKPLLHTWSLAVEEQFYLFFPLLLVFFKSQSRQRLFWWLACISIISLGGSVYGTMFHTGATFFLLPTRAWELLVGCMLAVLPWKLDSRPRRDGAIAVTGLFAIIVPIFCYDSETPFPGLAAIPPVIGTAAVIFATATSRGTLVGRVLSLRPVVFVGLISYSLYLWHWPVIVFVRTYFGHLGWKQITLALVCSLSLSVLSWKFIETPCRRKTFLQRRRRLFGTAFLMSGATAAVSLLLVGTGGLPSRFPNYSVLLEDTTWKGGEFRLPTKERLQVSDLPTLGKTPRQNKPEIDFIVWGDSHGWAASSTINDVANELGLSGKAVLFPAIPPLPNCYRPNLRNRERVSQLKKNVIELLDVIRPRNLVLIARWSLYTDGFSDLDGGGHDRLILSDNVASLLVPEEPAEVLARNLRFLVRFCSERGIVLWIVKQVPETGEMQPAKELFCFSMGRKKELSDERCTILEHTRRQAKAEAIFGSLPPDTVRFIDPAPSLFDSEHRTVNYRGGRSLYWDNDHLTRWGGESIRTPLEDMFRAMLVSSPDASSTSDVPQCVNAGRKVQR
jgi:peptidoglycan/LPS O-acetylase OafA/YrhL